MTDTTPSYELPHHWTEDPREPLFTFSFRDQQLGFFLFSLPFWIELLFAIVAQASFAALLSVAIYHTIIRRQGSSLSFFVGYGIILPFWIFMPRIVLDLAGIDNKIFRFCLAVITPTVSIFRTMEAMYGFTPRNTTQSAISYALYYGSPMIFLFDPKADKHIKASTAHVLAHLLRFSFYLLVTGILQSLFTLFPEIFPTFGPASAERAASWYRYESLLDSTRWWESALCAVLFQFYLMTHGEGLIFFTTLVTGKRTEQLMMNPMFESKSPSEFWGRRWNLLVHACLKNGIYKPVRSHGGGKALAVLTAFVASGVFHEWLLPTVFFDYPNTHGTTLLFFSWQAFLVATESAVSHMPFFVSLSKALPDRVKTLLVITSGIPLAHWFCDSYVRSNFFAQGHILLFSILPVNS